MEKKPIKGGTPAIEKRDTVIIDRKKKLSFKSEKLKIVLKLELINWNKVQKINRRVTL